MMRGATDRLFPLALMLALALLTAAAGLNATSARAGSIPDEYLLSVATNVRAGAVTHESRGRRIVCLRRAQQVHRRGARGCEPRHAGLERQRQRQLFLISTRRLNRRLHLPMLALLQRHYVKCRLLQVS